MSSQNLVFHSEFIYRSPTLPFVSEINSEAEMRIIATDKAFQEAIYIASPALYYELQGWLKGTLTDEKETGKLLNTLSKYYTRMCTRCTPFGLFAATSSGHWENNTPVTLSKLIYPMVRLDMDFICTVNTYLVNRPEIKSRLKFYPNSSLYSSGNQIRFIQHTYKDNKWIYNLTAADKSEPLLKALELARQGVLLSDLTEIMVQLKMPVNEAGIFVNELVESQMMVSELEPNVTGKDFVYNLIETLENINKGTLSEHIDSIVEVLKNTCSKLEKIDNDSESRIRVYKQLFKNLTKVFPDTQEINLFRVDTFRKDDIRLNTNIQARLIQTIDFLL